MIATESHLPAEGDTESINAGDEMEMVSSGPREHDESKAYDLDGGSVENTEEEGEAILRTRHASNENIVESPLHQAAEEDAAATDENDLEDVGAPLLPSGHLLTGYPV